MAIQAGAAADRESITADNNSPAVAIRLRTSGPAPRRTRLSVQTPLKSDTPADTQNGSDPYTAMAVMENLRSVTSYEGNHVSRK